VGGGGIHPRHRREKRWAEDVSGSYIYLNDRQGNRGSVKVDRLVFRGFQIQLTNPSICRVSEGLLHINISPYFKPLRSIDKVAKIGQNKLISSPISVNNST
jgi:hypothetical protein